MAILMFGQQLQPALVRIGCDLKLFNILAESPTPLTVESLAEKTGAAPTLLGKCYKIYLLFVETFNVAF